ncbi:MAG: NAD-binding protein [Euryarchaeota archaeon]|nr:NAD-binding protein [Euryarchaeota archaeon]
MGRNLRLVVETVRKVWKVAILVVIVYFGLSLAFYWAETTQPCIYSQTVGPLCNAQNHSTLSLGDALWWGIVTLSTVGYGDVVPHTVIGRAMGAGLMVFQIGFLGYLLTVILGAVTETRLKVALGSMGTDMKDHVVVAGYSMVGKAAVRELLAGQRAVAVICESQNDVPLVRELGTEERVFACFGNVTSEESFKRAGTDGAFAIIFASTSDTDNLIGALTARALYPEIRVVVSISRPELRRTLEAAGVTYIASPDDMGGRLCASAAFRPEVASTFEDLTTATYGADVQEYRVTERSPIANLRLPEAEGKVRGATDCLIMAIARPTGKGSGPGYQTIINPPSTTRFEVGTLVLVVGSLENLRRFEKWYGIPQGR